MAELRYRTMIPTVRQYARAHPVFAARIGARYRPGLGRAATWKASGGRPLCPRCGCPLRDTDWHLAALGARAPWRFLYWLTDQPDPDPLCPVCGALDMGAR